MSVSDRHPKLPNIFRIETGNTVGWQVRFERQKKKYSKFFSDSLHDGTDGAHAAAVQWRDTMREKLPERISPAAHLHTERAKRRSAEALNRTGVIGVGFSMYTLKSGGRAPYVTCHWRDPETGRRKSSSFSVNKHGLRGAAQRACRRLREGRGEQPTDSQVDYYVRKVMPLLKRLYREETGKLP
ncbi:MAG: AP2 domain-containing protein [Rhodothermales bacterium]|nr:AP2 domain-containing protein [Rhodothermales bacterium]